MRKKTKTGAAFLLCGAAAVVLAFLFPLSGDDWQWAVERAFPIFNGRYCGNLLTMLLTQHTWLRPFLFGGAFSFIAFALCSLFETPSLFPIFFLALVPPTMFAQVYQWTSGFSVYVTPVALLLACILLARWIEKAKTNARLPSFTFKTTTAHTNEGASPAAQTPAPAGEDCETAIADMAQTLPPDAAAPAAPRVKIAAATFLLCLFSFAGTLFAEHMTPLYPILSLVYFILCSKKAKKFNLTAALSFAFSTFGAVLMFKNPSYSNAFPTAHALPAIGQIFKNIYSNILSIAAPSLVNDNTALTIALCALSIRLISLNPPRRGAKPLTAFFALFAAYMAIRPFFPYSQTLLAAQIAEASAAVLFFIAFWATALFRLRCPKRKRACIALLAAMALICAILLAVDPTGPRCYFVCYVIWIAAAALLWGEAQLEYKRLVPAALSLIAAFYLCCLAVYGYSTLIVTRRARAAQNADTTVKVKRIPFEKWLWQSNPTSPYLQIIYKNYYGLPQSCELVLTD